MSDLIYQFEGIGTHWWIKIFDEISSEEFNHLKNLLNKCLIEFENNYSRFIKTSLISKLNRDKILDNPSIELLELINIGLNTAHLTNNSFNIGVGSLLNKFGYDTNYSFTYNDKIKKISSNILIKDNQIKIDSNTNIDLGGIGKGFLIDKFKDILVKNNISYFLINGGGDIYVTSDNDKEIEFALENPFKLNEMIGTIKIKNRSIASSSKSKRRWKDKNSKKDYHHLIDFSNQESKTGIMAVYTEGSNSVSTDVSSTALFVSEDGTYEKIAEYFHIEYLIILDDGKYIRSLGYSGKLFTQ